MSEIDNRALEPASEEAGVNPGVRLAEARELLKLGTADIARQLKLSVAQVEALESGHFDRLPGAVFVRGFIRNYARLVKLDPDELLREAGSTLPQQAPRPETPPSQDIPFPSTGAPWWRKYALTAAVVVAALAFYEFFVSGEEIVVTTHPIEVTPVPVPLPPAQSREEKASVAMAPLPAADKAPAAPTADAAGEPTKKEKAPAPQPPAAVAVSEPAAATAAFEPADVVRAPEAADPPPVAAAALAPNAEAPPAPNAGERQVTLEFEDESWVEIRDRDGKLILWQLNLPGTRQVVSGVPPLSFVIGNAHGVRLTYGDRPVDLQPYTKTDVARMTLE